MNIAQELLLMLTRVRNNYQRGITELRDCGIEIDVDKDEQFKLFREVKDLIDRATPLVGDKEVLIHARGYNEALDKVTEILQEDAKFWQRAGNGTRLSEVRMLIQRVRGQRKETITKGDV